MNEPPLPTSPHTSNPLSLRHSFIFFPYFVLSGDPPWLVDLSLLEECEMNLFLLSLPPNLWISPF
jgi:hypothetical protein